MAFCVGLLFFMFYKYPLFYMIKHTQDSIPNLYLINYIFLPPIACLTKFVLVNLLNCDKGLSISNLIFTYILSFIFILLSSYLVPIVMLLPEVYEFCSLNKIRDSIFPIIRLDSDSESSSIHSNASRGSVTIASESEQLHKSLEKLEKRLESCDNKIASLNNLVTSNNTYFQRYDLLKKLVLYIPYKGLALSDVFSEAAIEAKKDSLANQAKLANTRTEFQRLLGKRLDVLDRLEEID